MTAKDGSLNGDMLASVVVSTPAGLLAVEGDTIAFEIAPVEHYVGHPLEALFGTLVDSVFPEEFADLIGEVSDGDTEERVLCSDGALTFWHRTR